jgi:hypothetical protein
MASWHLATMRGVTAFELADFFVQVIDLIPKFDDGAICVVFDVLDYVALTIYFVASVLKFVVETRKFGASLAELELEGVCDGRADSLGLLLCRLLEGWFVYCNGRSTMDRPCRADIAGSSCVCYYTGLVVVPPGAQRVIARVRGGWSS